MSNNDKLYPKINIFALGRIKEIEEKLNMSNEDEYVETKPDMKNWVGDDDAYKNQLLSVLRNIDVSLRKIANYHDFK